MLKKALFAGAIVAALGCQNRNARDAAMAGAGAGAPAPATQTPVAQTVDSRGTTNLNTGTNVPSQARRAPIARRTTAHTTIQGTSMGFGTPYTPKAGLDQTASGNGTTTKTGTDTDNAGTSTP
jgi:hypothetical protein